MIQIYEHGAYFIDGALLTEEEAKARGIDCKAEARKGTMAIGEGGMIICATLAGTSSMETAKRNAPGMILAVIALMVLML